MVPVGGFYTIGPQEAKALLDDLRPKVFLPMHYRMGAVGLPAVGQVEDFLSLVENYVYYPTDTLSLDEGTKPQIAVLTAPCKGTQTAGRCFHRPAVLFWCYRGAGDSVLPHHLTGILGGVGV